MKQIDSDNDDDERRIIGMLHELMDYIARYREELRKGKKFDSEMFRVAKGLSQDISSKLRAIEKEHDQ